MLPCSVTGVSSSRVWDMPFGPHGRRGEAGRRRRKRMGPAGRAVKSRAQLSRSWRSDPWERPDLHQPQAVLGLAEKHSSSPTHHLLSTGHDAGTILSPGWSRPREDVCPGQLGHPLSSSLKHRSWEVGRRARGAA